MKKVVRLTESDLNRIVKKITEDFEDEWPEKSGEAYKNLPSDDWWNETLSSDMTPEERLKKVKSDPKWQEWQSDMGKYREYNKQRQSAYSQHKPTEEIKKIYTILDMSHNVRDYVKTRKEMINYIKRQEEAILRAKDILGI